VRWAIRWMPGCRGFLGHPQCVTCAKLPRCLSTSLALACTRRKAGSCWCHLGCRLAVCPLVSPPSLAACRWPLRQGCLKVFAGGMRRDDFSCTARITHHALPTPPHPTPPYSAPSPPTRCTPPSPTPLNQPVAAAHSPCPMPHAHLSLCRHHLHVRQSRGRCLQSRPCRHGQPPSKAAAPTSIA